MTKILLAISFLFFCLIGFSQDVINDKDRIQTDTIKVGKNTELIGVPIIFYTPETQFGFGGGAQIFFKRSVNRFNYRESNVFANFVYTSEGQMIIDVKPQIYFSRGNYFLDATYKYKVFPTQFWGIGPNTLDSDEENYNMLSSILKLDFLHRLPESALNFGFEYRYEYHDLLETEEGGQLETGIIPGTERDVIVSGFGVVFNNDNRDNIFSARKGSFLQINSWFASKTLGSSVSFNKYIVDLRRFLQIKPRHTLGLQMYLENSYGDVPFQNMAWLGGGNNMRGYFRGRYIDTQHFFIQGEWRYWTTNRLVLAGFGGFGNVGDYLSNMARNPKIFLGGGIRYQILKSNKTLIRLDLGFGESGSSGFYFGVNEAF